MCITTDGASNMKVAIRETFGRDTYNWCMAHMLELCAKDAAKEEDVKPLLEKVKELAASCNLVRLGGTRRTNCSVTRTSEELYPKRFKLPKKHRCC